MSDSLSYISVSDDENAKPHSSLNLDEGLKFNKMLTN